MLIDGLESWLLVVDYLVVDYFVVGYLVVDYSAVWTLILLVPKFISAMWISLYDSSLKGVEYYGTVCGYHGNRQFGCEEAEIAEECGKKKGGDSSCVCNVCVCECMKAMTVVKRECCWVHRKHVKGFCLYNPEKNERSSVLTQCVTLLSFMAVLFHVRCCPAAAVWV